jgi:hypothetical protein
MKHGTEINLVKSSMPKPSLFRDALNGTEALFDYNSDDNYTYVLSVSQPARSTNAQSISDDEPALVI